MRSVRWLFLAALLTGCAQYRYDLTQPPALARPITAAPVTLSVNPLAYTLQAVENHLVIRLDNPTTQPILLEGERSVIVDPGGESHPLASRTIAPGTYIKLILPPLMLHAYYARPIFVATDYRMAVYRGYVYDEPAYEIIDDPGDPTFFRWEGETDLRMTLTFQRADSAAETFVHSFVFHRRKAG
jgi:hypothetical protein